MARSYGVAVFSPGLEEVLLIKREDPQGPCWSFPFAPAEATTHIAAAAAAVKELIGTDVSGKITRNWIEVEVELPQPSLVRLYVALSVHPTQLVPEQLTCPPGVKAQWHALRRILPPVNAVLPAARAAARSTGTAAGAAAGQDGSGGAAATAEDGPCGDAGDEEYALLPLEAGIAPFLAKLKSLLNKHPEWRIAQLDPQLLHIFTEALAPPQQQQPQQQQQQQDQQQQEQAAGGGQAGPTQQLGGPREQTSGAGAASEAGAAATGGAEGGAEAGVQGGSVRGGEQGGSVRGGEQGAEAAAGGKEGPQGAGRADATGEAEVEAGDEGGGGAGGLGCVFGRWRGPRPQEHLAEYCRRCELPEPCYSLVVKKSARRPMVTASCVLPHLGVQVTPDMHVSGGMAAACQAAALAAILWLEGALPPDGGDAVRVVPVGWPPLLTEARGEQYEAAQAARRAAGGRRELDPAQREALLREMDKKRQRLVAEAAELERMMAALRGADPADMPDPELLQQKLPDLNINLHVGSGLNLNAAQGQAGGWGSGQQGDGGGGGGGLAGSVTMGMQALQFRTSGSGGAAAAGAGGRGGGRPPGTKRPREDAAGVGGSPGGGAGGASEPKNVIMELKELCDRKRWPQPQYAYTVLPAVGHGAGKGGATAVLTMPPAAGLGEVRSGVQTNKKRAKEAAAALALAQLSALGLK